MLLDDDETVLEKAEVEHLRFWLRSSKTNLLNYLRTAAGQAELK